MNIIILKIMLAIGIAGHAINMYCDRILSVFPNGRLSIDSLKDEKLEDKMEKLLKGVSPEIPMRSTILGAFSLLMECFGYFAISAYVYEKSAVLGMILAASIIMFIVLGTAHHVKYGLVEWVYIKMEENQNAKKVMMDLYNSGSVTKLAYAGYIVFVVTLIISILTGIAGLPLWMLIFTVLPNFIVLAPFRILGTLHISAMISMLAWLIFI